MPFITAIALPTCAFSLATSSACATTAEVAARVLGLSRFQHVLHFLQPVRVLLSGASTGTQVAHRAHLAHAMVGMSGGARFMRAMGGKLGLLSAVVNVPLFWLDLKSARTTLADPSATARDKTWTKAQLGLSGVSAATSVVGLGAAAIGLAAPAAW